MGEGMTMGEDLLSRFRHDLDKPVILRLLENRNYLDEGGPATRLERLIEDFSEETVDPKKIDIARVAISRRAKLLINQTTLEPNHQPE